MADSSPIRVLYMEDDRGLARLVQKRLAQAGYAVDLAHDGEEGLAKCAAGSYDVVAVDQTMPVRDGLAVIRILASQGPLPPTVMVTGTGDEAVAVEALKLGAGDYVVKDAAGGYLDLLPTVIEQVLGRQRLVEENQRAEQALRHSEERYRRITEAVTDYIFTVRVEDGQAVETVHGHAGVGVTGYAPEEFAADPDLWFRMVHEEDRAAVLGQAARILSGQEAPALEHRIVRKDGVTRWIRNTPVPHVDAHGQLVSYDGLIRDITERKQAEEALRESRARWRSLVEDVPDIILSVDREGRILFLNRAQGGVSVEQALGTSALDYAAPEHQETLRRSIQRVFQAGEPDHCEIAGRPVQETVPWYSVHLGPVKRGTEVVAVTLAARDITERKRAEEELKRTLADVEKFNRLAVGRELRMIELKREVNDMARKAGLAPPYDVAFAEGAQE